MNILRIVFACTFLTTAAFAFDGQRAKQLEDILASDAFQGRRPGTEGGIKAEEFLANQLKSYGIENGGDKGYFQDVPLLVTEEREAELTLMNSELGKINFLEGADFTLITHSGSGAFIAPVVIAGYGYIRPDKDRDDYGEFDVSRKIVVIIREHPDSPYDFTEDFFRTQTLAWAKQKGAAAVIWYQGERAVNGGAIPDTSYDPNLPMLYIGNHVLSLLLDNTGYSIDSYKEKLKKGPFPLDTKKNMWVKTEVRKLSADHARNVLGMFYGSDPVLRNEIVVIGAHLDHIGMNSNRIVYNGADDDGSGTVLVSELARSLAENHDSLKRSVMIIHFTGEEDGLLGSEYFAAHPIIPFGNIACMLNFDMVGQGNGDVGMAGGNLLGPCWRDYVAALSDSDKSHLHFYHEEGITGATDGFSFLKQGAPTVGFWSDGRHPFYHHYDDDADWISASVLQSVGSRAEDFLRFVCNYPGRLAGLTDSVSIIAKLAENIDFDGFDVNAKGTLPEFSLVSAAWLPADSRMPFTDLISRAADLEYECTQNKISADGLKQAVQAEQKDQRGIFLGLPQPALIARRPEEIKALIRQGMNIVRLGASNTDADKKVLPSVVADLRDSGVYALIPLDFGTPARVDAWKGRAIVRGDLKTFAGLSATVREGLLKSDAMVVLEVSQIPSTGELQTLNSGRVRQLHLNFATVTASMVPSNMSATIRNLYAAGYTRNDVMMLTGGNLRRYLDK